MQQFDIKVEKTILIFDEGHNLQQQAESIGSAEISSFMLDTCIDLVDQLENDSESKKKDLTSSNKNDRQ